MCIIYLEFLDVLLTERESILLPEKGEPAFAQVILMEKPLGDTCVIKLLVGVLRLTIQNGADSQIVELTLCSVLKRCQAISTGRNASISL